MIYVYAKPTINSKLIGIPCTLPWPGSNVERLNQFPRLDQLDLKDLYLGRPVVLFSRACRIDRQKIDFSSYVELSHVRNLMHTLQMH